LVSRSTFKMDCTLMFLETDHETHVTHESQK